MKLSRLFFLQDTLIVARELLGCFIFHAITSQTALVAKIVETEAYDGARDLASHASKGRTPRTELMFGEPGFAYIYLVYGMHYCFNIVTGKINYPAAILIRASESVRCVNRNGAKFHSRHGIHEGAVLNSPLPIKTNGPGKFSRAMRFSKRQNGEDLTKNIIWFEKYKQKKEKIIARPRIGVDYAGLYKDKPWRFYLSGNPFVSKE